MQQPTSTGLRGGEPGSQNAFLLNRGGQTAPRDLVEGEPPSGRNEVPPPKLITSVSVGDTFTSWCAGGGGMGDPLDRDPDAVSHDVAEGLVSPEGAAADYGVVIREGDEGWTVDVDATSKRRHEIRRERLGGREPSDPVSAARTHGRRLSSELELASADGQDCYACRRCGQLLGPADQNVKLSLIMSEAPTWERWRLSEEYEGAKRFVVRRFHCPSCATQMFVDVNLRDEGPTWSLEPFGAAAVPHGAAD